MVDKITPIEDGKKNRRGPEPGTSAYDAILRDLANPSLTKMHIAQKFDVPLSAINRMAYQNGLRRDEPLPGETPSETSGRVRRTYNKDRRVELIDDAFEKLEGMLSEATDPQALERVINGLSKLIDKRRLEDGEATQRTETSRTDAKDSLTTKLNDLAVRSAQQAAHRKELEAKEKAKKAKEAREARAAELAEATETTEIMEA